MSSLPQPLVAYPRIEPPTKPSSNSKGSGSYSPVFVVLAMIAVVAVVTCIIGHLCARRLCHLTSHAHAKRDMEHGLSATAKVNSRNDGKMHEEISGTKGHAKIVGPDFGAKPIK